MADTYYNKIKKDADLNAQTAEDIKAKFDASTKADYAAQRAAAESTENDFYNKMYGTNQTVMDDIRKSNAAAVTSGANKGIEAANQLASILGLQQESVSGATNIANEATNLAKEETAALGANTVAAETQATAEQQAIATLLNQAGLLDINKQTADTADAAENRQMTELIATLRAEGQDAAALVLENRLKAKTGESTGITTTPTVTPNTVNTPETVGTATYDKGFLGMGDSAILNGTKYKTAVRWKASNYPEEAQLPLSAALVSGLTVGDVVNVNGTLYLYQPSTNPSDKGVAKQFLKLQ